MRDVVPTFVDNGNRQRFVGRQFATVQVVVRGQDVAHLRMVVYLAAGGSVNVKSAHVPADKTYAGNGPEDDTVWTFR